jgi:FimV-like protein
VFKIRSFATYIVFALCLAFATLGNAVGFGNIKVYSYLDEPLLAELEIVGLNGIHANMLNVKLADDTDFSRAGIEKTFFVSNLLFDIFSYNDRVYVKVSSPKAVKDPYLEFLVNLSWPDGSLIKDYTVLIDPPPVDLKTQVRELPLSVLAAQSEDANAALTTNKPKALRKHKHGEGKFSDDSVKQDSDDQSANQTSPLPLPPAQSTKSAKTPVPAPTAAPTPELVPNVVPEVGTEEEPVAAPIATPAAPPVAAPVTKATPAPAPQAAPVPPVAPTAPQMPTAQNRTRSDTNITTVDVDHIAAARQKHLDMYKDTPEGTGDKIDFGDVIKPSTLAKVNQGAAAATPSAPAGLAPGVAPGANNDAMSGAPDVNTGLAPGMPGMGPEAQKVARGSKIGAMAVPPEEKSSFGLYVALMGLVTLVVAAGIIYKTGLYRKFYLKKASPNDSNLTKYAAIKDDADDADFDEDFDFDVHGDLHSDEKFDEEDIELSAVVSNPKDTKIDMDNFEDSFANLDLDKLAEKKVDPTTRAQFKTVSDLLNIGGVNSAVAPSATPLADSKIDLDKLDAAFKSELEEITVAPISAPVTAAPRVEIPMPIIEPEIKAVEPDLIPVPKIEVAPEPKIEIAPEPEPKLEVEPKPEIVPELKLEQTPELKLEEVTELKLEQLPELKLEEAPEPKLDLASDLKLAENSPVKMEPTLDTTSELKLEEAAEPKLDLKSELKLEEPIEPKLDVNLEPKHEATPVASFDLDSIFKSDFKEEAAAELDFSPVADKQTEASGLKILDSDLRIAPETVPVVPEVALNHVEIEELNLKIKLAKQYLSADDRESAKHLLNEVISQAKGAQLEEAKVLLDSIE